MAHFTGVVGIVSTDAINPPHWKSGSLAHNCQAGLDGCRNDEPGQSLLPHSKALNAACIQAAAGKIGFFL
jgi:hypothetical protein